MEEEVTDLISRVHLKLTIQLQYAEREVSDVLYPVPTMKQRNRDRNAQRRQSLQRLGNKATKRL